MVQQGAALRVSATTESMEARSSFVRRASGIRSAAATASLVVTRFV